VVADYDGDQIADIAVFRETTGEWFVARSGGSGLLHVGWGSAALGDLPVPGDYDADGRTDIAVYRQTTGEWFILRSSDGSFVTFSWGEPLQMDGPLR
jgi:hypothetical protein